MADKFKYLFFVFTFTAIIFQNCSQFESLDNSDNLSSEQTEDLPPANLDISNNMFVGHLDMSDQLPPVDQLINGDMLADSYDYINADIQNILDRENTISPSQPGLYQSSSFGNGTAQLYALTATSDGGYATFGNYQDGAGATAGMAIKYSSTGAVQWAFDMGLLNTYMSFFDAIEDSDGNLLVTGIIAENGVNRGILVKFSSTGNVLWTLRSTGEGFESFTLAENSNVIFLAGRTSNGIYIGAVDSSLGLFTWHRNFTVPSGASGTVEAVRPYGSSQFLISGHINGDAFLGKFNPDGSTEWVKQLDISERDAYNDVTVLVNGNILAVGGTGLADRSNDDILLSLYSSNGEHLQSVTYGGAGAEHISSVTKLASGELILAGRENTMSGVDTDSFFIKANMHGNTFIRSTSVVSPLDQATFKVRQLSDQRIVAAGFGGQEMFNIILPIDLRMPANCAATSRSRVLQNFQLASPMISDIDLQSANLSRTGIGTLSGNMINPNFTGMACN